MARNFNWIGSKITLRHANRKTDFDPLTLTFGKILKTHKLHNGPIFRLIYEILKCTLNY